MNFIDLIIRINQSLNLLKQTQKHLLCPLQVTPSFLPLVFNLLIDREKKSKDKEKDKDKKKDKKKLDDSNASRVLSRKGSKSRIEEAPSELPDEVPSPVLEQIREKECFHHRQKLTNFCETCEEPICEQCVVLGPHNNQVIAFALLYF